MKPKLAIFIIRGRVGTNDVKAEGETNRAVEFRRSVKMQTTNQVGKYYTPKLVMISYIPLNSMRLLLVLVRIRPFNPAQSPQHAAVHQLRPKVSRIPYSQYL